MNIKFNVRRHPAIHNSIIVIFIKKDLRDDQNNKIIHMGISGKDNIQPEKNK